ncbi:DUF4221 family protein [Massilibacteroides sp.]|uniref:DUF4221 family protein n=1 Tax=Massilibacteroides sp. TaxID=2034766 RepID=UPI00260A05C7|nr:DUF4221 family protein [Massilibacteroides sp.]MDD4516499.1 DUF4221 family protein [Massilibacteroides sp.]
MIKKTLYFLSVILLSSCLETNKDTELIYNVSKIPIDFPYISDYGILSIDKNRDTIIMGGYNYKTHSLDLFDLSDLKTKGSLKMETQGVNEINDIQTFAIEENQILIKNMFGIKRFSWDLQLLHSFSLTEITDHNNIEYITYPKGIRLGSYSRLYINNGKDLLLPIFPSYAIQDKAKYHLGIRMDLNNGKYDFLPISYSDHFSEDIKKYGNLLFPFITQKANKLIYNYPYSSTIYIYDLTSQEINKFTPQSRLTANEAAPISQENISLKDNLKYQINAIRFLEVNSFDDYFYRVHLQPINEGMNAQAYLMIFDKDFQIIREFTLPSNFKSVYASCDNLLYFLIKNEDENPDEYLSLAKIDLRENIPSTFSR